MKLYYIPGACSLSPHVVLREAGLRFDLEKVDPKSRKTESGADFDALNPKGYVPVLELDDGERLAEGAAIVQYLADSNPGADLAPSNGSVARAKVNGHLTFISSELHKAFSPLFGGGSVEQQEDARQKIARRLGDVEATLADGRPYIAGQSFTIADAYLFTIVNWTRIHAIDLAPWPNVAAYMDRVATRPAVQDALKAEGLI